MRRKTATMGYQKTVIYEEGKWELLRNFRQMAAGVMYSLGNAGFESYVYGSLARGDVSQSSDIDIIIPGVVRSFMVELALDEHGITGRKLVQATPGGLTKAHVYLPGNTMVTFPLVEPNARELDFYAFGGQLGPDELEDVLHNRVPGVDKRLMLIEPTPEGHIETPLSDLPPGSVARKVGVGQDIIDERTRVLNRRARVGITGVYLDRLLAPDDGFEAVLEKIAARDSLVRRRVRGR